MLLLLLLRLFSINGGDDDDVPNINPFANSALLKLMNSCTNGSSTKLSSTSNPPGALELLPYAADIVCRARIAYLLFCLIVATTLDASALMIAANDIAFDDGEEDNSLIAILLSYPSALSLSLVLKGNETTRNDTKRRARCPRTTISSPRRASLTRW